MTVAAGEVFSSVARCAGRSRPQGPGRPAHAGARAAPLHVAFDGRDLALPVLRGMGRYAVGLVGALARCGVRATLFHPEGQPLYAPHLAGLGCETRAVRGRAGVYWEQVSVPLALLRGRFDIYHAPAERGVPFVAPCPVVWTCHSVTGHSYYDLVQRGLLPGTVQDYLGFKFNPAPRTWRERYWLAQAAKADHVLTVSDFSRREIMHFLKVPPRRVTVTPLAVHDQFRRPPRPPCDRERVLRLLGVRPPFLLYVGGYEAHKNVRGLLEVFAAVRCRRPDLSLVLVGSKSVPAELRREAVSRGLFEPDEVLFLRDLTDELTDLYDAAELFVSMSWRESFGLPLLEAMARGRGVVASAWGAAREVVGGIGRLVDPRDRCAAAQAVLEELTVATSAGDEAARRTRRAAHAARQFSWARTAAETVRVYERVLGLTGAGPRGGGASARGPDPPDGGSR